MDRQMDRSHRTLIKLTASFRWSFGPNSAWDSIEMMTIRKTHSTSHGSYDRNSELLNLKSLQTNWHEYEDGAWKYLATINIFYDASSYEEFTQN